MSTLADYAPVYRVKSDKPRDFGQAHETIEEACAAITVILHRGGVGSVASVQYELTLRPVTA